MRVQIDPNLRKGLKTLRRMGGRAACVAEHVESIVQEVVTTGGLGLAKDLGRATRNGEARIKNAVKFDLVDGYRLLAVRQGDVFAFLFVGTHDECDRWVRNNSGVSDLAPKRKSEVIDVACPDGGGDCVEMQPEVPEESDEYPFPELSERELRIIFSGLCGGGARPQES